MKQTHKAQVNTEERVAMLAKVSIFEQTKPEVLKEIAESMEEVSLKVEQNVFKKGDRGKEMYVIVDGAVRVHDGKYVFAVLRQGQVFGEYSVLVDSDTKSRSASVTAVVKTRLLRLSQSSFFELMANRIEIVQGILKVLIRRSRRQNYYEEKMNEQSQELERQRDLIQKEKETSEKLLLNILPAEVAEELKLKGKAQVREYELASVLFSDIKGFTEASGVMTPEEVLRALEFYFITFDEIITKHHIEKIKTIGDAYMCAGGIPLENRSNPVELTLAALEMQRFMKERNQQKDSKLPSWELRIGINTGPLIAGVIGKKKFVYDIWGDTVNVASRMESTGSVNRINVSGSTYEHIKAFFECEPRGKINAKGKGEIDMFFVNRILPSLSKDAHGLEPNAKFLEKMKALNRKK